jgi:hypothetical protein
MKRFAILLAADIFDELLLDPAFFGSNTVGLVFGLPSLGLNLPLLACVNRGQYDPGFVLVHLLTTGSSRESNSMFSL